jgi:CheY-like chemotaxis protein
VQHDAGAIAQRGSRPKQNAYQTFAEGLPKLHLRQVPYMAWNRKSTFSDAAQAYGETFVLNDKPVDILVVEDNDSERDSIVESLQASIRDVHVIAVHDGTEALDFLFARGAWTDRVGEDPPRLVLLDLALPGSDGFSVLGQIRSLEPKDALTLVPVVIFTDSQAGNDVTKSYRCGANSYIIKPLSFPDFQAVVSTVGQYWMMHNKASF